MNVLLVNPPTPYISINMEHLHLNEPLALEYLGASLSSVAEVSILDMRLDRNLSQRLSDFKPDVVGVTGYTIHVPIVKSICEKAKNCDPGILTIVGGHHAMMSARDFIDSNIDLIVTGDGIPELREIVDKFSKKQDYTKVSGIAYLQDGHFFQTNRRQLCALDSLPFPDRSLTKKYRKDYFSGWCQPEASIRTSRGCPFRCNFCAVWKVTGGKYFVRKVENIVHELSLIDEKYVFFADDETFIRSRRMVELAEAIEFAGIKKKYMAYVRADTVVRKPYMLKKWKRVGLDCVFMGLEFLSKEDLDSVNKNVSPETNIKAIEILRDLDIRVSTILIVKQDFDKKNFFEYAEFAHKIGVESIKFSILTPLPGTDLYEKEKNNILDVSYEFYDCAHTVLPLKLSYKEFYFQLFLLYIKTNFTRSQLSYLIKMPRHRLLKVLSGNIRTLNRLKNMYKDYSNVSYNHKYELKLR